MGETVFRTNPRNQNWKSEDLAAMEHIKALMAKEPDVAIAFKKLIEAIGGSDLNKLEAAIHTLKERAATVTE